MAGRRHQIQIGKDVVTLSQSEDACANTCRSRYAFVAEVSPLLLALQRYSRAKSAESAQSSTDGLPRSMGSSRSVTRRPPMIVADTLGLLAAAPKNFS